MLNYIHLKQCILKLIATFFCVLWLTMPFEKATLAELGRIERCRDEYRAHLQFRTETGSKTNIHGPRRTTEHEAQKDLVQIRAGGSVGATRKDGLKLMETEAKSIKISAAYQAQIQEALRR